MLGERNIVMISLVGVLALLLIITIAGVFIMGHQSNEFQKGISDAVFQREELQEQLNNVDEPEPDISQQQAAAQLSELQDQLNSLQNEVDALRQERLEAEEKLTDAQHQLTEIRGY